MSLSENERLLKEVGDKLRKSTSILEKMLKEIEAYAELRKAQTR